MCNGEMKVQESEKEEEDTDAKDHLVAVNKMKHLKVPHQKGMGDRHDDQSKKSKKNQDHLPALVLEERIDVDEDQQFHPSTTRPHLHLNSDDDRKMPCTSAGHLDKGRKKKARII